MKIEKTNFQMVRDFESYKFEKWGFISEKERRDVESVFCIKERTNIDLCNLRDFIVMYYGLQADKDNKKSLELMDKMSAITAVIDEEKWNRGMKV